MRTEAEVKGLLMKICAIVKTHRAPGRVLGDLNFVTDWNLEQATSAIQA